MSNLTYQYWSARASSLNLRSKALIHGDTVPARSGRTFRSVNPATGETLIEMASCSHEDVEAAVGSARQSFRSGVWSRRDPAERKTVLLRLSQLIRNSIEELALLDSLDTGTLVSEAYTRGVPAAALVFERYAKAIDTLYGEAGPASANDLALAQRVPVGVVGVVVPWGFPLETAALKCAPALAAGNSVVLKPAEHSSFSAIRLGELALEAGLPAGVLNVIPGLGPTAGQALGRHMDVDCLTFSGSAATGKMFLQYSGQSNMKQVWLETSGKVSNLVFADCADIDKAAELAAFGAFHNQGQACSVASRLLVERSLKDALVERLVALSERFRPGDPLDPASTMGAMVDAQHVARAAHCIEAGRKTARLVVGGEQVHVNGHGCYVLPTIFNEVEPGDPLDGEDIPGPVLVVIPFDSDDEAVALANDAGFGSAALVSTDSRDRAHDIADRLHVGTVCVNMLTPSPMASFGGIRQPRSSRDPSLHALDKYTVLKTTRARY